MLGEQIGEEKGKVTGQRILDIDESGTPKIETTFSSNAKFKGIDTVNTVTYWTVPRPGGMLYWEAKGVVMSKYVSVDVVNFSDSAVGLFTYLGRG